MSKVICEWDLCVYNDKGRCECDEIYLEYFDAPEEETNGLRCKVFEWRRG